MGAVRAVMMLALLLLVTACTITGDEPPPADPAAPAPTSALAPRPRDVRIDGVDPCSLLTEAQRAELGLDGKPVFDLSPSLLYPGEVPMCVTRGFEPRAVVVSIALVPTAGIEFFLSGDLATDMRVVELAGFPAAVARPTQFTQFCNVVVDVAPGRLVDVQVQDGGQRPAPPQGQLCQEAERAANAVMDTLLTRR